MNVARSFRAGCEPRSGAMNVARSFKAGCEPRSGAMNVARSFKAGCEPRSGAMNVARSFKAGLRAYAIFGVASATLDARARLRQLSYFAQRGGRRTVHGMNMVLESSNERPYPIQLIRGGPLSKTRTYVARVLSAVFIGQASLT
jgi:hypothetical protein